MEYFTDNHEFEVIARVARQWVFLCKRRQPNIKSVPIAIGYAISQLPPGLNPFFQTALFSLASYCGAQKWTSTAWLDEVRKRSKLSLTFRAVFFFDYKATRRNPHVINKGVKR